MPDLSMSLTRLCPKIIIMVDRDPRRLDGAAKCVYFLPTPTRKKLCSRNILPGRATNMGRKANGMASDRSLRTRRMSVFERQTQFRELLERKSSVLVAKSIALVTLIFCLLVAFGLFISQAVGAFDSGSLSGYLIYCVVTLLLAWDIYRAKPVSVELAGRDAEAPAIGAFNFTVLVIVIVFLMALTLPALAFGAFDSGYLIYCVITSLLAWGTYRAKSIARALVMLFLAALAFLALAGGAIPFQL